MPNGVGIFQLSNELLVKRQFLGFSNEAAFVVNLSFPDRFGGRTVLPTYLLQSIVGLRGLDSIWLM